MIEANEDITLVVEHQLQDVQAAQEQAKAVAEGRQVHPALSSDVPQTNAPVLEVANTTQQADVPTSGHPPVQSIPVVRLSLAVFFVLLLLVLVLRRR